LSPVVVVVVVVVIILGEEVGCDVGGFSSGAWS
jgi:hypothetical protein